MGEPCQEKLHSSSRAVTLCEPEQPCVRLAPRNPSSLLLCQVGVRGRECRQSADDSNFIHQLHLRASIQGLQVINSCTEILIVSAVLHIMAAVNVMCFRNKQHVCLLNLPSDFTVHYKGMLKAKVTS